MDLVEIPDNPVPSGAVSGTIETEDGRHIRFARWRPTARRNVGTVCVFTGRAEFIEKYFETVSDLRRRGFNVAIIDWRGQGGSDRAQKNPAKGHVDDFEEYERDVAALMTQIVLPDCPPPYFALGHSMGGCVLLGLATQPGGWFERIVMTAPMVQIPQGSRGLFFLSEMLALAGFGSLFVPGGTSKPTNAVAFAGNPFTGDPVRLERVNELVRAEPRLGLGAPTIGWLNAAGKAMARLQDPAYGYSVRTPVLIVAAGDDKVVSTRAIERLAVHMRGAKHLVIPGARHEILMERDSVRELFWAAFDGFVPGEPVYG